jgi:hypothetical protein
MTMGPGKYEFDVAVSFAGEDREFVQDIVDRLKGAGISVFYDTDYRTEMWGEDLVEYLDQIYRTKASYTMMFISRFYAEKMWTSHERRSALARALEQRSAYILAVRLDSTPLEGLRPTVGYLDARQMGSDGIVRITLAKLTGSVVAVLISRVPRTEVERQQVLLMRPGGWEYLYFVGQLLHERNNVEGKSRDHEIHYAPASREVVERSDIVSFISLRANDAQSLMGKLSDLVNSRVARERAFGPDGQPADPERLAHLAKRWNSVYEEFMDWAARIRGVSAPSEFRNLLELLARYADPPVEQYRGFVDEFVAKVDALPAALAAGETVRLEISLTLSLPDEVTKPYKDEFDRLT